MITLLKKLGLGDTLSAIVMIVFGGLILWKPDLLAYLVAAYLVIVGVMKLVIGVK